MPNFTIHELFTTMNAAGSARDFRGKDQNDWTTWDWICALQSGVTGTQAGAQEERVAAMRSLLFELVALKTARLLEEQLGQQPVLQHVLLGHEHRMPHDVGLQKLLPFLLLRDLLQHIVSEDLLPPFFPLFLFFSVRAISSIGFSSFCICCVPSIAKPGRSCKTPAASGIKTA